MKRLLRTIFLLWIGTMSLVAQTSTPTPPDRLPTVNKATSLGMGKADVYDTYLSPLTYKGNSYHIHHERVSHWGDVSRKWTNQQIFQIRYADAKNPTGNANEHLLLGEYRLGAHKQIFKNQGFRLSIGGVWNIEGGAIYNRRNSNNPVSVKALTNLNLSGQAFFQWKSLLFRWQMDTPLLGAFFAPEYGESLYEVSLGGSSNIVHLASVHNQRSLLSQLSVDVPINKYTLRLTWQSSLHQSRANGHTSHLYGQALMLGLVSENFSFSGKKARNSSLFRSAFSE